MEKKLVCFIVFMLVCTISTTMTVISDQGETNSCGKDTTPIQTPIVQPQNNVLDKSDIFYASNLHDDDNLSYFSPGDPGTFTIIGPSSSSDFLSAGDFVEDTWYASEYSASGNSNLWTIDHLTGAMTLIGSTGVGLNGLAYDDVTQTLYGCDSINLYTIDTNTAASTLIGAMGNSGTMIGIAFDSLGNLYGEDLADDNLYSINPNTGSATVIGSLGINLNYAQDMAIDKETDICYITGYKGSTNGGGALYTVDKTTGLATFIGDFPIGTLGCPSEVSALAIPYQTDQNISFSPLQANWNLVSIPFNQTVNLTDLLVEYDGTNYTWDEAVTNTIVNGFVFGWDRTGQSYEFVSQLLPGEGYWIFAYEPCDLWAIDIPIEDVSDITSLHVNWNLFGSPLLSTLNATDLMVTYGSMDYTWDEAVTNTIISGFVFGWDRSIQSYYFASTFDPGYSYWLFSYHNCDIWCIPS